MVASESELRPKIMLTLLKPREIVASALCDWSPSEGGEDWGVSLETSATPGPHLGCNKVLSLSSN